MKKNRNRRQVADNPTASPLTNENRTKTYFRFSHGRQTIYFGHYIHCCQCPSPTAFITRQCQRCPDHFRQLQSQNCSHSIPTEYVPFTTLCSLVSSSVCCTKTSRRLGVTYKTTLDLADNFQDHSIRDSIVQYATTFITDHRIRSRQLTRLRKFCNTLHVTNQ